MKKQYIIPTIELRRFGVVEAITVSTLVFEDPNTDGAEFDFDQDLPT